MKKQTLDNNFPFIAVGGQLDNGKNHSIMIDAMQRYIDLNFIL